MRISSIIFFGVTLGLLLIFSCISLNAPKYYNELETVSNTNVNSNFDSKHVIVLRDRRPL